MGRWGGVSYLKFTKMENTDRLKYFMIAKKLNEKHQDKLKTNELHFRGNIDSFSIISLKMNSPLKGKGGLNSIEDGNKILKSILDSPNCIGYFEEPKRPTPEKKLQAWIIYKSMIHEQKLPFDDFIFLTEELAFMVDTANGRKKIVTDILAFNIENKELVIIELKAKRDNSVKQQCIDFEEVVKENFDFFKSLVCLLLKKEWNGKVRKIAVWPWPPGKTRERKYPAVDEVWFKPNEKTKEYEFSYKYRNTIEKCQTKILKL